MENPLEQYKRNMFTNEVHISFVELAFVLSFLFSHKKQDHAMPMRVPADQIQYVTWWHPTVKLLISQHPHRICFSFNSYNHIENELCRHHSIYLMHKWCWVDKDSFNTFSFSTVLLFIVKGWISGSIMNTDCRYSF